MRIAVLADSLDDQYAGVFTYAKELIGAFLQQDQKDEYLFIHLKPNTFFKGRKEIIVRDIGWIPFYGTFRKFVLIPRLLRKENIDLVHDLSHFGPFLFSERTRYKKIITVHDCTPLLFPKFHVTTSVLMHRFLWPRILKNADQIIAVSADTKNDLVQLFPFTQHKISVVPLGVSERFKPTPVKNDPASVGNADLRSLQKKQLPYILSVGTLEPRKNISLLIAAFEHLIDRYQLPHKLVLIGKYGWKPGGIKRKIEHSNHKDRIMVLGYVKEDLLPQWYSSASVLVYPSLYEGFGLPPLEAMACECPVVASDTAGLRCSSGNAAYLVKNNSVEELASALYTVLTDEKLKNKLVQTGRNLSGKFTWHNTAKQTIEVYRSARDRM